MSETQHDRPDADKLVGSDRVLAVLLELAEHPTGISLDELARRMRSSKPTVHRALASLRRAGLASQSSRGTYELGDEFVRLAFRHHDARPDTASIEPVLRELALTYGETTHYAVLERPSVVYRAKVDPPEGAMRLTSTVGGRKLAFSTAVGKLLMSLEIASRDELDDWLGPEPLPAYTEFTITDRGALLDALLEARARGYAVDDQETDLGVNCLAVPVTFPDRHVGAVSVSGLRYRRPLESLVEAVPVIRATIARHLG